VTDKVVDASAVVALLFNEQTRDAVAADLRGASLHAPSLLEFEVANACLKKIRALPNEQGPLLQAFSLLSHLAIRREMIDLNAALAFAKRTDLSLYDASYLWLAQALDAELVTLDGKLSRAHQTLSGSQRSR
jgi:predicted nucleic acid-binding protein